MVVAKASLVSIDDYIAAQPAPLRPVLERVRAAIRKALPHAEEVISYRMPAYKQDGKVVVYFAGWSRHFSIYPAGARLVEAFQKELASYEVSKGTIRFPLGERVPVGLIRRIARFRLREIEARNEAK